MKKYKLIDKNFNLAEIISLGLIFYIVIVIFALCIGLILTTQFGTKDTDIPAVLSNMFVWSATLIAPIIAILLINSWRLQKNFENNSQLLSLAEENLIRFWNQIDPICRTLVTIHENYFPKNGGYYFASSLHKQLISRENAYLTEFYIHMERYTLYNKEDTKIKELFDNFHGIAVSFLHINHEIVNKHYLPIYELLSINIIEPNIIDSFVLIGNPSDPAFTTHINKLYQSFNIKYDHSGYSTKFNKESNDTIRERKNYKEFHEIMKNHYTNIIKEIQDKNRA
ncbi:hypothetical protein [Acinetobacter courvalinii]|uniref:hypothetical protein n=1 Tax=Acinetobacter courvalinii TaxID=280147 RepID=UPI0002D04371|nr:hypothetical protein [Acinetobacter courvalinii]ENX06487.1 hypothetical protein F898_03437 [Acinetobacter courvalinii]